VDREPVLEAGGLRLAFRRCGDRFLHELALRCGDGWVTVLQSREGNAHEEWPPSPPLQEARLEARPEGRRVALLVGMAGSSHWSLSVEADAAAGRLSFEAACRAQAPPRFLGSTYRAAHECRLLEDRMAAAFGPLGTLRLRVQEVAGVAGELQQPEAGQLLIVRRAPAMRLPATFRWGYLVEMHAQAEAPR
jgi:hypothetical protein